MLQGWSGLMVEADPNTFMDLQITCKGYPAVACRNVAVWDKTGKIEFFSHNDWSSGLSSAHRDFQKEDVTKYEVDCVTLDQVLESHYGTPVPAIDFMSVDIEGCDYATLKSYSWQSKPRLLMVERKTVDENHYDKFKAPKEKWEALLSPLGYRLIWENYANLAFDRP